VLLVEDNAGDARLLREMFNERASFHADVTTVQSMREAEKHVSVYTVDIIVLDLGLPDAQGLDALRRVHAAGPNIPVVVLTGLDDEALAVRALQEGAQDYLVKGQIEARGLLRALRYAVERKTMEVNINYDLVELKRAEAELRESEMMLRIALDVSDQGLWRLEIGQRTDILDWDARCRSIFGLALDAPVNYADWASAISDENRVAVKAAVTSAMDPADMHDDFVCEYRAMHPDGSPRWIAATGRAVFEPDDTGHAGRRVVRILGTMRDVSEAKRAVQAKTLAATVRTAILQNTIDQMRILALEKDRLLAVNQVLTEELREFAYIASHDLKAPLRAISLLADWITEDIGVGASAETVENLQLMRQRAGRLQMLIEGLVAYTRVGHAVAPVETVDLGAMLAEIVDSLAPPAGFVVRFDGLAPVIDTKRPPLEHVLQNLISNAIKHHDRPVGEIVVSARTIDGVLEFSVRDDGPGIEPAFHKRVFTIFATLAGRDEREASGVGLSIVQKIVERFGGKIWIKSAPPARGATFVFTWNQDAAAMVATGPDVRQAADSFQPA